MDFITAELVLFLIETQDPQCRWNWYTVRWLCKGSIKVEQCCLHVPGTFYDISGHFFSSVSILFSIVTCLYLRPNDIVMLPITESRIPGRSTSISFCEMWEHVSSIDKFIQSLVQKMSPVPLYFQKKTDYIHNSLHDDKNPIRCSFPSDITLCTVLIHLCEW